MANLKLTAMRLSKCIGGGRNAWSPRGIVTATRPLQQSKSDKEVKETCDKVTEAAEAVKEGANKVTNMTKEVTGKVSEAAEKVIDKAKDTVFENATQKIKDAVVGK